MVCQEASRAQKRKAKAAAAAAEREARIADENAAAGDSARVVEEAALRDVLRPLGLAVRDIAVRAGRHQLCGVPGFRDRARRYCSEMRCKCWRSMKPDAARTCLSRRPPETAGHIPDTISPRRRIPHSSW